MSSEELATEAQKREAEDGIKEPESKKQRKLYESEPSDKKLDSKEPTGKSAPDDAEQNVKDKKTIVGDHSASEDEGSDSEQPHMWHGKVPEIHNDRSPELVPDKDEDGYLVFKDHPEFRPNLSPKEVIQRGSFGGTYFRPIYSSVLGEKVQDDWKEYPQDWFEGLDPKGDCCKAWEDYDKSLNTFKVKCGRELEFWEGKGWISPIDPRGWFQWYCRFYLGRRTEDDERQIGRAQRLMGPHGRFRLQLINRCYRAGKTFDDESISPVMRQVLQHWGYVLTEQDFNAYCQEKGYDI